MAVRFWLLSQDAHARLEAIGSPPEIVSSAANVSDLTRHISFLEGENRDLRTFASQMADVNAKATRVVVLFIMIAAFSYFFEERRIKQANQSIDPTREARGSS